MKLLDLNRFAFVDKFLVSGPFEEDFVDDHVDDNQLHYEAFLRSIVYDDKMGGCEKDIRVGRNSSLGMPWRFHFTYGDSFVDYSKFYFTLKRIRLNAAFNLYSQKPQKVKIRVWSYARILLYKDGELQTRIETPRYKPIMFSDVECELKSGINEFFVALINLGVRDTRTLFGIEIRQKEEEVSLCLPDMENLEKSLEASAFLSSLKLDGHVLRFTSPAPQGSLLVYDNRDPDFSRQDLRFRAIDISSQTEFQVEKGNANIIVKVPTEDSYISRKLEILEEVVPKYGRPGDAEGNKQYYYERMAAIDSLERGFFGFSMPHILARKALGKATEHDRELLLETLQQINDRYDCSDFLVGGLIRYVKNYEMDETLAEKVRQTFLSYRYWMTMKGSDAMCFWSENHAMQFYACAYLAGGLYPDEYFVRAERTGKELQAFGRDRIVEWMDSVDRYGFEEFLSTCYMCVTFAALINLVDYAEPEISLRATRIIDRIMRMLSSHTFRGSIIAPMGRVYRNIIYPFQQGAQVLLNLVNPDVPTADEESWLASYATSSYRFPSDLVDLMNSPVESTYSTGNALVKLEKTQDYCITSVQSPRLDGFERWENLTLTHEKLDCNRNDFIKSLNERFHGSTSFESGKYGYQQHMWVAALSNEAILFANHPGGTFDASTMRPGYWYGNGVMPAVLQKKGCIAAVYSIPDEHPVHFTHVFLPRVKFDLVEEEGNWIFLRKDNGLLALWCSEKLVPYSDELENAEMRAYADDVAYVVYAGSGDPGKFKKTVMAFNPIYNHETRTVMDEDGLKLTFEESTDRTQYI